jgi:hypothetical protein
MGIALATPPLPHDVEVTGPVAARFWVSSSTEDMDLFLTIRNFDAHGNEVLETGQQGTPVPVAKGWLRVSHRELDPELSLPYRPYHRHRRRLYLARGEIVRVDVEIWPTSMVFRKVSRRLQYRHQHHLLRRRDGIVPAAADHSAVAAIEHAEISILPAIHVLLPRGRGVDARDKRAHDGGIGCSR